MRLSLKQLQAVVGRAVNEERAADGLRTEVSRVLGPVVITEGSVELVAEAANDRMDVLDRTGRSSRLEFKPSVMVKWLDHSNPEVRKFAARVVPSKFLANMTSDNNSAVRATVARRVPIGAVREMLKRFPKDDQIRVIYKEKRLAEAGLPKPEEKPMGFDPAEDAERLGDSIKQDEGPELSENWYHQLGLKFMQDYGGNIEDAWEEVAVRRFVASTKATSGVEIDEGKLLKAIKKLIEDREDRAMERSALKETLEWLNDQDEYEVLSETVAMPLITFDEDPVRDLYEGSLSPSTYIDEANSIFRVQEATVPPGIRKHRLGERNAKSSTMPVIGYLPHRHGFRALDERALDVYCKHWSDRQALQGEPLRLEWSNHPSDVNKISFNAILR